MTCDVCSLRVTPITAFLEWQRGFSCDYTILVKFAQRHLVLLSLTGFLYGWTSQSFWWQTSSTDPNVDARSLVVASLCSTTEPCRELGSVEHIENRHNEAPYLTSCTAKMDSKWTAPFSQLMWWANEPISGACNVVTAFPAWLLFASSYLPSVTFWCCFWLLHHDCTS